MEQTPEITVVIPAFRSEGSVGNTIDSILAIADKNQLSLEIIVVDDNSPDRTWSVIKQKSKEDARVKGISLIANYGQHSANIVGFKHATGLCIITMDDDLQNPPSEILKLLEARREGHDLVVGVYEEKKHGLLRRLMSDAMHTLNRRIFASPPGFRHTNFRLIDRSVIDRMLQYRGRYPYTSGLAVMYSNNPVNTPVRHAARQIGASTYTLRKLLRLSWNIVFNYSTIPMKLLTIVGFGFSLIIMIYCLYIVIDSLIFGTSTPGWASIMALVSISNAVIILMLTLLGNYLATMMDEMRSSEHFHIKDTAGLEKYRK